MCGDLAEELAFSFTQAASIGCVYKHCLVQGIDKIWLLVLENKGKAKSQEGRRLGKRITPPSEGAVSKYIRLYQCHTKAAHQLEPGLFCSLLMPLTFNQGYHQVVPEGILAPTHLQRLFSQKRPSSQGFKSSMLAAITLPAAYSLLHHAV